MSKVEQSALTPEVFIERDVQAKFKTIMDMGNKNVLLMGPTGSGKTTMPAHYASQKGVAFERFPLDNEESINEHKSRIELAEQNGATVSKRILNGMAECIQRPGVVLFDDASGMGANKMFALHPLLDSGVMHITGFGEIVKHKDCQLVAALNPHTGMYSGTNKLDASFVNRFICMEVPQFTKEELMSLLPKSKLRDNLINFYLKTHEAILANELDFEFSVRNINYIVDLYNNGIKLKDAIQYGFLDSVELVADKDTKNLVLNIALGTFPLDEMRDIIKETPDAPSAPATDSPI